MRCFSPVLLKKPLMLVPCGKCLACRKVHAFENSLRCLMELTTYQNKGCFVTLTYNDNNLPMKDFDPNLEPSDLQKFFKRLRKRLPLANIKYFACGEYGGKFERPHYHAIVFGLSGKFTQCKRCNKPRDKWCFPICESWKLGNVTVDPCTMASVSYVCGYIEKKYYDDLSDYKDKGITPPFQRQSQRLGLDWFRANYHSIIERKGIVYNGSFVPIPRYFIQKLRRESDEPDEFLQMIDKMRKETDDEMRKKIIAYIQMPYQELLKLAKEKEQRAFSKYKKDEKVIKYCVENYEKFADFYNHLGEKAKNDIDFIRHIENMEIISKNF